jgi:hypothetical protein
VDLGRFKEFEKTQKAKKVAEVKKDWAVGVEKLAIVGSDGK